MNNLFKFPKPHALFVFLIGSFFMMGFTSQTFPKENLAERLEKLVSIYHVNISYDKSMISNIEVAAIDNNNHQTLEQILIETLDQTSFIWQKLSDGSIVIKPRDNSSPKQFRGKISGKVMDEKGEFIVGATVIETKTQKGTATDFDGNFTLSFPPGEYTIRVSFISYQTIETTNIKVTAGKTTPLNVLLKEDNFELEGVVVSAEYKRSSVEALYAKQKASVAMTDGISSEMIKKTSDNNVAQTLKRIAGVNVKDGKYVVVRGMSERYNNVEVNGASMPSTEPNRRNFSFDIIPTSMVDNVIVAKTFTPDMQGEFSGGLIKVNTLAIPYKGFLKVGAGTGYNTLSTGKDFLSNSRFKDDYFLGSDKRNWYTNSWRENFNQAWDTYKNNGNKNALIKLGKDIPNHYGMQKFTGAPTQNYSIATGKPFQLQNQQTIGFVASLAYRHEENTEKYTWNSRKGTAWGDDGMKYKFITTVGALFNAGWKSPNHHINWKNFYNYRFNHTNWQMTEYDESDHVNPYRFAYHSPMDNQIMQSRLEGNHQFWGKKLTLDWFGDYNLLKRNQPEDRQEFGVMHGYSGTGSEVIEWMSAAAPDDAMLKKTYIYSSVLNEIKYNLGGNLQYVFTLARNRQKIKTGYWGTYREAEYHQLRVAPTQPDNLTDEYIPVQEVFSDERRNNGHFYYEKNTLDMGGSDSYKGNQNIKAAYLMGDFAFLKKIQLTGGVRLEQTKMTLDGKFYVRDPEPLWVDVKNKTYKDDQWLPAATLTYNHNQKLKFKAAYGKTIARPDFRERTPIMYWDAYDRYFIYASSGLKNTITDNYDLRLEWYPKSNEIFSINAFYKNFNHVVENLIEVTSGGDDILFYVNLDEAIVKGMEVNLRLSCGFISQALSHLILNGNATYIDGNVEYSGDEIDGYTTNAFKAKRLIIGLAPKNLNGGLEWDTDHLGISFNYRYTDRILHYTGPDKYRNEYIAPRNELSAQLRFQFFKQKLELKINGSNLTNDPFIQYRNTTDSKSGSSQKNDNGLDYDEGEDVCMRKVYTGRTYSLSVTYNF